MAAPQPWTALDPAIADRMRPYLAQVADDVIAALPQEVPSYARPLEGAFGEGVRLGVQVALGRFLELPGTDQPALAPQDRKVYAALGRGELRQGRTLEALLAAYRVGARVAFRRFADLARAEGMHDGDLIPLAESVFAYIDVLSAASVEGFAQEQSLRAGEVDRRRRDLLALLIAGTADAPAVAAAATAAGWAAPEIVIAVVVGADQAEGLAIRLGPDALVAEHGEAVVAVLPAPTTATERGRVARRLAGRQAAVGPARPLVGLSESLRLAMLVGPLVQAGIVTQDPALAEDHLVALVLHRDPALVAELSARLLAPLDGARGSSRERLAETLLSWLRHRGERQHVAAELHVHPQTVGYRLGRLRELFGPTMDDPDGRFALELALRARH